MKERNRPGPEPSALGLGKRCRGVAPSIDRSVFGTNDARGIAAGEKEGIQ
jgi:hypothetical protein